MENSHNSTDVAANSGERTARQCIVCDRPDSEDDLVQCDRCDLFVHFSCAGVNDSIANPDRSFVCKQCTEKDELDSSESRGYSQGSRSSRSSAQLALGLRKLQEENQLRLRKIDEEERFRKMRLEAEEQLLKEKYELLQADLEHDYDKASRRSGVSRRAVRENTESWVKKGGQTEGANSNAAASSSNHPPQSSPSNHRASVQPLDSPVVEPIQEPSVATQAHPESTVTSTPKHASTESHDLPGETAESKGNCTSYTFVPVSSSGLGSRYKVVAGGTLTSVSPPGPDLSLPKAVTMSTSKSTALPATPVYSAIPPASAIVRTVGCTSNQVTTYSSVHPRTVSSNLMSIPSTQVLPPTAIPSNMVPSRYKPKPTVNMSYHIPASSISVVPQPPPGLESSRNYTQIVYDTLPLVPPPGPILAEHNIPTNVPSYMNQSTWFEPWNSGVLPAIRSFASVPPSGPDMPMSSSFPTISSSTGTILCTNSHTAPRTSVTELQAPGLPQLGFGQTHAAINTGVPHMSVPYGSGQSYPTGCVGPNAIQIAARQVIPRELPVFSGDPQDWPIFYSSFRNSTEVCGYSDAENLSRLQRCLRGHALEAVRSRLLIPASVPQVMATLQRLYGRPEVIINALLKQLRNVPAPRADDLKTLIRYGMAVQNLVEHMVVAEQQHHLSNPMLLYELVDRLPPNFKLEWANTSETG